MNLASQKFRHLALTFVCWVFMACAQSCSKKPAEEIHPVYKLLEKHCATQLKKNKMVLVAGGIPEGDDDVSQIAMHYIVYEKKMKLPRVRELFVSSVEDLLEMVNGDERLRPRLKKYPMTYRDIHFTIGFCTVSGEYQEPPYIAYAYLVDGIVYYSFHDRFFLHFMDAEVQETYETAREQAEATNQNCSSSVEPVSAVVEVCR